ncbi:hypothetical protein [Bremerella cremea]|uniref:hypothetical protein n=1 Tax=Bremerella cremea TaxID=1031537 RepID=UPI0031EA2D01
MHTPINQADLSAQTIHYGDVQIGGSGGPSIAGSAVRSTPPQWSFTATNQYNDAQQTVIGQRVRLDVQAIFYSETEALSATQLKAIRRQLLEPRQTLSLAGTGCGLDSPAIDIGWGPRPLACTITMQGSQTASLQWSVELEIASSDVAASLLDERLKSFDFAQSYRLDDQGLLTRVTRGSWQVASQHSGGTQVADSFRAAIDVEVPAGFRRVTQVYDESTDKSRIDFQLVDVQLAGDALPAGIAEGEGSFSFTTEGIGLARGTARLTATLTVAPGVAPNYAFLQFWLMAEQKQSDLQSAASGGTALFPIHLSIERGLWERARTSRFEIVWQKSGGIGAFLSDKFWTPLSGSGDYSTWSSSIAGMWHQRGTAGLASTSADNVSVNLASAASGVVIATSNTPPSISNAAESVELASSTIDPNASWLDYDVQLKFFKDERTTWHRRAVDASRSSATISDPLYGTDGIQPQQSFDATDQEDIAEEHGLPTQYVLLKAKGLRVQYLPVFPTLTSLAGQAVALVKESFEIGPATSVGHIVYQMRGYRLYKVLGTVASLSDSPASPSVPPAPSSEEPEGEES